MTDTEEKINVNNLSEELVDARCKLITSDPWYGTMAMLFKWTSTDSIKTMGVRFVQSGGVECFYNPKFCETLTQKEISAVIQHEIEHIVKMHPYRGYGVDNHDLFNVACDMLINGKKSAPLIQNLPKIFGVDCVYMPEHYDLNKTAEEIYELLLEDQKNGKSYGNGFGDDHSMWGSDVDYDVARQTVKEMCKNASGCGNAPGHLVGDIEALNEPIVDWKYELQRFVARQVGNKRATWSRQNRRMQSFGFKGKSSHASVKLTVLVDTSGSVGDDMLEQFFTELEGMSRFFSITVMQFDHGYQHHCAYKRGDWQNIKVHGRGGTSFIEAFNEAEKRGLIGRVNIVCTDGYAPWPEAKDYPVIWAVMGATAKEVKPPFGDVIYLSERIIKNK